jgi:hypothetical protein
MKILSVNTVLGLVATVLLLSISTAAQGTIDFRTLIPGIVNAPARFENGEPVGTGFTGQLYGGSAGSSVSSLTPAYPTVPMLQGYVAGAAEVQIPGVPPAVLATVVMRVYNGSSWETSLCRGESLPITIQLSGGSQPGSWLTGLQGFTVYCIPEPAVLTMASLGVGILLLRKPKKTR